MADTTQPDLEEAPDTEELTEEKMAADIAANEQAAKDAKAGPKEAEPAAEEEPELEAPGKPEPGKKRKTVPYDAMFEERERRKEAERKLQEFSEKQARLEERTNLLLQRMQANEQPKIQPQEQEIDLGPDPREDPVGALEWAREQRRIEAVQRREQEAQRGQQSQAEQEWQFVRDNTIARWEQAKAARPELANAYETWLGRKSAELQALGWQGTPLRQQVEAMERQYLIHAYRNQVPIERFVETMAQSVGWSPPQQQATNGNGQSQGAAEVSRLQRAQGAAQSLSTVGGSGVAGVGKITAQVLADMSDKEYSAWWKANGDDGLRKVMGG